ncbi:MAG: endonuclease/exonuclease/phosphatase family protein, partial [Clostridia bacterium]|nr:endonuclease/exonuclease/phosphatase family protein [Clostridia bacterium]
VQEASVAWMNALNNGLGDIYATVGVGRDGVGVGEHSAIFYRKDQFTLIESGTKWLSYTPDVVASKLSQANYPRIMTYAVLERNCDGVQFLYVNTHLDHDGKNGIEGGEKVRQEQIEILIAEINKLGNYPTIVTGDFNVTQEASAYTTMIANGFIDASRVSKAGERKPTYNGMDDQYAGVTIDYIFVSGSLLYSVDTYKVCPAKRNDEWISDHNAIVATITLPIPTNEK